MHKDETAIQSAADLDDKKVGVGTGSTYETYLDQSIVIEGKKPVEFPFNVIAYAAGAITQKVAAALQQVYNLSRGYDTQAAEAANLSAEIEAAQGQAVISRLVLESTTGIFDALGASATARANSLDRHWRNARTIASHNPVMFKERVIGDFVVNQTPPPYLWLPGES